MADQVLALLIVNALAIFGIMIVLWLISIPLGQVSFIDSFWALGFVIIAWISNFVAFGNPDRHALITGMVTVWGLRLGLHLFLRWRREGEDKRYVAILTRHEHHRHLFTLGFVFLLQGVLLLAVSLPAQWGQLGGFERPLGLLALLGAILWAVGLIFETVGDWQLSRFRAHPDTAGKVLDTGLWRYTRHPNYFGDACVWWGVWLVASEASDWGLASAAGPAILTYLLVKWSGKPLLERGLKKSRPDYADYIERTSGFIPRPPRAPAEPSPAPDRDR